jgi:dihydroorotase
MSSALLITNAMLVCPHDGTEMPGDCLIVDRRIAAFGASEAPSDAQVFDARGAVLAPGLVDAGVFRIDTAASTAAGITAAILMPDQSPPLDEAALVERAARLGKPTLWAYPLAAATRGLAGRELAEMATMRDAGAVGVATGRAAIADTAVMLRVMRYAAGLGMVVMVHPEDPHLVAGAAATEGETATRLGLPAAPAEAEPLALARDLRLAEMAGCALHISCVTTAESVALLRAARARGQNVSAATAPDYLLLNDAAVTGYRSFARLSPPLRSESDREALRAAVADGTVSVLASRHDPRTVEEKRLPFADAAPGAAGAATLLALSLSLVREGTLALPALLHRLSTAPARRFGLPGGRLAPGEPADLVLFRPEAPWRIDAETLPGIAGNTPFDGLPTEGQVVLTLKGGDIVHSATSGAAGATGGHDRAGAPC